MYIYIHTLLCLIHIIYTMRKTGRPLMQVINVDTYHCLVHLPYNLHAITVYVSHGIPLGGWGLVGSHHVVWAACMPTCLFKNMKVFGASFTDFCLDTTQLGHAHLWYVALGSTAAHTTLPQLTPSLCVLWPLDLMSCIHNCTQPYVYVCIYIYIYIYMYIYTHICIHM